MRSIGGWQSTYDDALLQQEMLLRVIIIEETIAEIVVVSVYKTSQIGRYLRGLMP